VEKNLMQFTKYYGNPIYGMIHSNLFTEGEKREKERIFYPKLNKVAN
jgi:hypothetical protein